MIDTLPTKTVVDTLHFMLHNGHIEHKPLIDEGELFYAIVGTRDLIALITGIVYAAAGLLISLLVPDIKIPDALKNTVIPEKWKRALAGMIVTYIFLYIFGFSLEDNSQKTFILFCFGCGFLNYHLTSVLINISTGAVSKIAGLAKNGSTDKP